MDTYDDIDDLLGDEAPTRAFPPVTPLGEDGLTERQREVADLLANGMTQEEVGAKLGIHPFTVKQHALAVKKKLRKGLTTTDSPKLLEAVNEIKDKKKRGSEKERLPVPADVAVSKVINGEILLPQSLQDALTTGASLKTEDCISLAESAWLRTVVAMMDPERLRTANMSSLSSALRNLTDNVQLLKGLPTAIVRHEDMRKLDEVGKLLAQEMKRRGITIDGEATPG